MSSRLEGRVALVTGGAQGQGAAEVRRLHAEGARVVAADVDDTRGAAVAEALGDRADYVHLDVADADQWDRAVGHAVERFGHLDVLVNNAGVYRPRALLDETPDGFMATVAVNQLGVFLGIRAAARVMAPGGAIINVASANGVRGVPGSIAYSASKWAVRGLSKVAAVELAGAGIRVNCLLPGLVATRMLDDNTPEELARLKAIPPLQRVAEPDEVAAVVSFLASADSSYMTGAELCVDGGATI